MLGLFLFVLAAKARFAYGKDDLVCSSFTSPSQVFVTLPPTTITETVYAISTSNSNADRAVTVWKPSALSTITTYVLITSTAFVNVPLVLSFATNDYSFREDNGSPIWLGSKTPSATVLLVTKTLLVTVSEPTSFSKNALVTLTVTSTETSTVTIVAASKPPPTSLGAFAGLGPTGWNASIKAVNPATTLASIIKSLSGSTHTLTSKASEATPFQKENYGAQSYNASLAHKDLTLELSRTFRDLKDAPSTLKPEIRARQVGALVFATIDGVLVSWKNSYNGEVQTVSKEDGRTESVSATDSLWKPTESAIPLTGQAYTLSAASIPSKLDVSTSRVISSTEAIVSTTANLAAGHSALQTHVWVPGAATAPPIEPLLTDTPSNPSDPEPSLSIDPVDSIPVLSAVPDPTTISSTASTSPQGPSDSGLSSACTNTSELFTVDFDDLPHFSIVNNPDGSDIPPIANPYRKLYFEKYFGYVPPPSSSFQPRSPPQLAIYTGAGARPSIPKPGQELAGEIGAGPRANNSVFWFDAFSVWLGCDNGGPADCNITINGYTHGRTKPSSRQSVMQPPCPRLQNCSLSLITFNNDFRSLNGLQISAMVGVIPVDYYMDDLELGWSNKTCVAQQVRSVFY